MFTHAEIVDVALSGDLLRLDELIRRGADINAQNEDGETVLSGVVSELANWDRNPECYRIVSALLERGADPRIHDKEGCSPLIPAMLTMDTELLRLLLEAGATPNSEIGFSADESLYDWAEFDYRFEVHEIRLPENPTEDDRHDEESWLRFLDRLAIKYEKRRPDHLFLLRNFGAKTFAELEAESVNTRLAAMRRSRGSP